MCSRGNVVIFHCSLRVVRGRARPNGKGGTAEMGVFLGERGGGVGKRGRTSREDKITRGDILEEGGIAAASAAVVAVVAACKEASEKEGMENVERVRSDSGY